jgi:hypothetical protein
MTKDKQPRMVPLEVFDWQWDDTDKDANFKKEVQMHSQVDPMPTIETMNRSLGIPIGAIVRYILVKWAASGSTALMEIGPDMVRIMAETVDEAEAAGTDDERLRAYDKLRRIISWLKVPITDPDWRPGRPSE